MKIVMQNTTDWPDEALKVVLRWVARQVGCKTAFRIKVRNGKHWTCSSGNAIIVTVPKRGVQKFPLDYYGGDVPVTFETRLQILVWSVAWCLQTNCERWDRFNLAKNILLRFHQHRHLLHREIIEVLKKRKAKKQKPPKRCAIYSAVLHHIIKWERRLKLAQTKVKRYKTIAERYERQFEKESRQCQRQA